MSMHDLTLATARDGLRRKRFSARELTAHFLDAIEVINPRINAFITVTPELALAQAAAADAALARGEAGPASGCCRSSGPKSSETERFEVMRLIASARI